MSFDGNIESMPFSFFNLRGLDQLRGLHLTQPDLTEDRHAELVALEHATAAYQGCQASMAGLLDGPSRHTVVTCLHSYVSSEGTIVALRVNMLVEFQTRRIGVLPKAGSAAVAACLLAQWRRGCWHYVGCAYRHTLLAILNLEGNCYTSCR